MQETSKKLYKSKVKKMSNELGSIGINNSDELLLLNEPIKHSDVYSKLGVKTANELKNDKLTTYNKLTVMNQKYSGYESYDLLTLLDISRDYFLNVRTLNELGVGIPPSVIKDISEFEAKFKDVIINDTSFVIMCNRKFFTRGCNSKLDSYIVFYIPRSEYINGRIEILDYGENRDISFIQVSSGVKDFTFDLISNKYFDSDDYGYDTSKLMVLIITSVISLLMVCLFVIFSNSTNNLHVELFSTFIIYVMVNILIYHPPFCESNKPTNIIKL